MIYAVVVTCQESDLWEHISTIAAAASPSALFLYQKGPMNFPYVDLAKYFHAQDRDGFFTAWHYGGKLTCASVIRGSSNKVLCLHLARMPCGQKGNLLWMLCFHTCHILR